MSYLKITNAAVMSVAFHALVLILVMVNKSSSIIPQSQSEGYKKAISIKMFMKSGPEYSLQENSTQREEYRVRKIMNETLKREGYELSSKKIIKNNKKKSHSFRNGNDKGKSEIPRKNISKIYSNTATNPFNSHEGMHHPSLQKGNQASEQLSKSSYISRLIARIESHKHYPKAGRNKQGVSIISFNLSENGDIYNVRLEKSSGYTVLDIAAVDAVSQTKMNEFPPREVPRKMSISLRFIVD